MGSGGRRNVPPQLRAWDVATGDEIGEVGDEALRLDGYSVSADEQRALLSFQGGIVTL